MLGGYISILSACFVWGLVFVLPTFLKNFSPLEIALGRYFFFGLTSTLFFICFCRRRLLQHPLKIWLKAFQFSLIINIFYYTAIVLAVNYSSPSMATLITGIAPISVAFYGNWLKNECRFVKLILPSILIFVGLFIVNFELLFDGNHVPFSLDYFCGIFCAFFSLICLTWYFVANTGFLKTYPLLSYYEWSTMLGIASLVWVILAILILNFFVFEEEQTRKFFLFNSDLKKFFVVTAVLGCLCSWCGSLLWNAGCTRLPISLSGQLTIFETIFGLTFVYVMENRFPTLFEFSGVFLMLIAIISTLQNFSKIIQSRA